jgi:anti-repressor protein
MSELALSNLSFFEYGSRQVRTAMIDGSIVFCMADVLRAMKSSTTTTQAQESILDGLGEGHVIVSTLLTSGGEQSLIFIDEAALTFLLSRSRTEAGKGLNRLIHTQILPTIRATGRYEVAPPVALLPSAAPAIPPTALALAPAVPADYREAMLLAIDLHYRIESDAPLVEFAKAVQKSDESVLVGTFAKTLGDVGPNILMGILRGNGILMTSTNPAKHNIPYQTYIDQGYFVVDEGTVQTGNKTRLTFTTRITPKGQIWLTNKYYEWQNVAA